MKSRGNSVSIVTRVRAGRPGIDSLSGLGSFQLATASKPSLGATRSLTQWISEVLSPGVKGTGREVDHSPPPQCRDDECMEL
jgi:hypothetical protein